MFRKNIEKTIANPQRVNERSSIQSLALRACRGVEHGAVELIRHPCHDCEHTRPEEGRGDHNQAPGHSNLMTGPRFLNHLFGGEHRELVVGGNSASRQGQFLMLKAVRNRVRTQTGAKSVSGGDSIQFHPLANRSGFSNSLKVTVGLSDFLFS